MFNYEIHENFVSFIRVLPAIHEFLGFYVNLGVKYFVKHSPID